MDKIIYTTHEFLKKKKDYALVIPVYNEGERIVKQLKKLKKYTKYVDIIISDGDSNDGSMKKSFLKNSGVRAILVKKQKGKLGVQYRMAFKYAIDERYKGLICMDGNNKDGPSAIPKFIKELEDGYDYVQGSRFIKGGKAINTPVSRYFGIRYVLSPLLSLGARKIYTDTSNGYRAFSIKYLKSKKLDIFRDVFFSYEILFYLTVKANQLGFKSKEIAVTRRYPKGEVPTKIKGFRKNFAIIEEGIKAVLGFYDPKHDQ